MHMLRAAVFAALLSIVAAPADGQERGVLRVRVTVTGAQQSVTPVPRHALLVSDNPPTTAPRRIVTAADGTATIRLLPGRYTVESDRPVRFEGRPFEWRRYVDITAGSDISLELTADNALREDVSDAGDPAPATTGDDPAFLLTRWQQSVVTVWTPHARVAGFVIDGKGLVVTTARAIGDARVVEVQLTPALKVAARVLEADASRDVAVLWIAPDAAAEAPALPVGCERPRPAVAGQELFAIAVPVGGPKELVTIRSGIDDSSTPGGPVFAGGGAVVGLMAMTDDSGDQRENPVVPVGAVCEVVASATARIAGTPAPDSMRLPVEPVRPFPMEALRAAASRRGGNTNPYQLSSPDFDIALITPVLLYAAQNPPGAARGRPPEPPRALANFGNWSDYLAPFPPVLLVRITPRMVEGFWTRVGRAAASTQGVALPPITRLSSPLARLRAFCGAAEVTPIHPFTITQRAPSGDAFAEGLYVFDPSALGPGCGTVRFELYPQKAPAKPDTRVVDPAILQQIWDDFAPHRAGGP